MPAVPVLMNCGLDEQTLRWMENLLNGQNQNMVISVVKSSWRPVPSSGSTVGLVLFIVFRNDLGGGAQSTLSRLADDTKLAVAADTPDSCTAIQRNLDRGEIG